MTSWRGLVPRFVRQRRRRDAPPVVDGADALVVRHDGVVEEHLVEVELVGDLAQRPDVDARLVHVDGERRDALVLRRAGVGARQHQAPIGELGVGRPHLLAGEAPPAAAVADRLGRQRSQVAAGARLREQLAPQRLGREDLRQPPRLLVGRAVGQQGGADQVDADAADQLGARARASSSWTM
ncbi:MAG: hypothetical protein R2690_05070 [Acidimicrobiales bacterium]